MDAFYPYITRTNTQPVDTPVRLILPVAKYQRIHAETGNEKKFRVGWQEPKQRQQQAAAEQQFSDQQHAGQQAEPASIEQQLHLIPTSHTVTPDAEAHVDADGHLDIYV
ncbi:hypothetical protein EOE67_06180 [Rheinheimera riviphila]|uniref:Uncharacterized protein n=1 Tax=Rheinheimera riviphila TaxID=1834037 RepID=A0A437R1F1_9GAMM|nr:hypothetical protein [Rheinheimera riviphila]RVU40626.1 hypothetical protein EOE67_06180 [Rheinheimera riviphila]